MQHPPEAIEANRATYWYPILDDTDLPIPDAKLVEMKHDFHDYLAVYENPRAFKGEDSKDVPSFSYLIEAVEDYGTPCFLRSDLSSAKHFGLEAIKVKTPEDTSTAMGHIIEHHGMDFLGANPNAWMIRPWIKMKESFRAFERFDNNPLPIPPEYRVFVTGEGEHVCTHFYWPKKEFQQRHAPDDAPNKLAKMKESTQTAVDDLEGIAKQAGDALGKVDAWSVDFALDADDNWWLIDVADARTSWHPEDCPHATT
jgi:hypothetical protein